MGTNHTPEPWVIHRYDHPQLMHARISTVGEFGESITIAQVCTIALQNYEISEANAARIVACVNSCAGFSNEELETLGHFKAMHETIVAENKQLRKERIKMRSLLLQFISAFEGENEGREMTKEARLPEPKWVKEAKQITK